ncbi:hypothetical protein C2G38_2038641 [Gigaspora rosea]|uniref:Uncharacterized protein n=1 Tax=Gigaspora rosea TaxID=44941 RepID=A0A397V415_9GLOM|nr:hypothetical protein C2G38_2038641 [Gigaspora rosea]
MWLLSSRMRAETCMHSLVVVFFGTSAPIPVNTYLPSVMPCSFWSESAWIANRAGSFYGCYIKVIAFCLNVLLEKDCIAVGGKVSGVGRFHFVVVVRHSVLVLGVHAWFVLGQYAMEALVWIAVLGCASVAVNFLICTWCGVRARSSSEVICERCKFLFTAFMRQVL